MVAKITSFDLVVDLCEIDVALITTYCINNYEKNEIANFLACQLEMERAYFMVQIYFLYLIRSSPFQWNGESKFLC